MATDGSPVDGEALRALWAEAEQRLYPVAISDPGRYERGVRIVRALADHLTGVDGGDLAALIGLWGERDRLLSEAMRTVDAPADLPSEVLAGAAFSFRRAALLAANERRQRLELIEEARRAGSRWVRLAERGDLDQGVLAPFHALDLDLSSGLAIVQSVEMEPTDGSARHVLSVIRLDPSDGEVDDLDPGFAETVESDDADAHRRVVAEVRDRIERSVPADPSDT